MHERSPNLTESGIIKQPYQIVAVPSYAAR